MMTIYKNALVCGAKKDICISDGKIVDENTCNDRDTECIDLCGLHLYPGLIDIHTHGCMGADTMDADISSLKTISDYLATNGTLSYLPTTMTDSIENIRRAVETTPPSTGAEVLGFHIEGPYISPKRKGAQNEAYIRSPQESDLEGLYGERGVKIITVAPEIEGCMEFIKNSRAKISIGHTDADYDISCKAMDGGADCLTHTFNAMPPMLHRDPGPVGAAIEHNAYVQVICDGLHLHKSIVNMLYRTFGRDRMILISDSMKATGLSCGSYIFGRQTVTVKDGIARVGENGALAGSTSTLLDCVKKAVSFGIPEADAFYMATRTPADYLGIKHKGRLCVGCDADIIGVDEDLELRLVIKGGKRII